MRSLYIIPKSKKTLGTPMNPAHFVLSEKFLITRVLLTTMSGETWYEYVARQDFSYGSLAKARRWNGKEISINTDFLVEAENFTLLHVISEYDSPRYNDNGPEEYCFLLEDEQEITCVDGYYDFETYHHF